jgi:hypothetical protein
MSYDLCAKEWNEPSDAAGFGKHHRCVEPEGHFFACTCKCGARRLIRDVPLRKWEPKPVRSRRDRRMF